MQRDVVVVEVLVLLLLLVVVVLLLPNTRSLHSLICGAARFHGLTWASGVPV